ncbi:hypothetical protein LAZ67_9000058 [Cordylochernes scorpioides]|uniref:Uncharacterized protein n=1 Tax=Cordylochernes scorpioides TaxID=51811 RepID=A0ABY6KTS2_9ARAC|nr:hypothetical protein LAZ67_9000058 [Cordylochernes scorpioides]
MDTLRTSKHHFYEGKKSEHCWSKRVENWRYEQEISGLLWKIELNHLDLGYYNANPFEECRVSPGCLATIQKNTSLDELSINPLGSNPLNRGRMISLNIE